jgi:hypothetical protein
MTSVKKVLKRTAKVEYVVSESCDWRVTKHIMQQIESDLSRYGLRDYEGTVTMSASDDGIVFSFWIPMNDELLSETA